jgi:mono/diheme cytochrome c family protein
MKIGAVREDSSVEPEIGAHDMGHNRQVGNPATNNSCRAVVLVAALLAQVGVAAVQADPSPVTFTRDIAPILQANCQECHHPGGIGPFSLLTYADAKAKAEIVRDFTRLRIMPPWKAADGFGEFADVRRLTEEQIGTIARWVESGAPEGDPGDLPSSRPFVEGWMLGTPDMVLDAGEPFDVPASGDDIYRNFVLPLRAEQDQWVTAVEVRPGSPAVVHHVVLYIDPLEQSPEWDEADPGPGFTVFGTDAGFTPALWLDGWAPGATPRPLPPGAAWRIPAGSRLVMQVHYHPHGFEVQDLTRIGLHLARGPVDKRVRTSAVGNTEFEIPPGASRHRVTAGGQLPLDITVLSVWPHMHLIGKEMKVAATLPNGAGKPMVWIPEWDFNWQQVFTFKEPLKLPQGTRLALEAFFDNSIRNPFNPNNPPEWVTFGPQSTDEMCFCFFRYTVDRERLSQNRSVDFDGMEIRN